MLDLVRESTVRRYAAMATAPTWPDARTAPLLEQHERDLLCAALRSDDDHAFLGPFTLARRAGVVLVEAPVDCVVWTEALVLYRPQIDERSTGLFLYFGLAGAMLQRCGLAHRSSDQWQLALECSLPARTLQLIGLEYVSRAQRHVPLWLIAARREALAGASASASLRK